MGCLADLIILNTRRPPATIIEPSLPKNVSSTIDMASGCDEGSWRHLSGEILSSELIRPALLQTIHKTDCVTLQPCTNPALRSQDRFVVLQLEVGSEGKWAFTAVFDGKNDLDHGLSAIEP